MNSSVFSIEERKQIIQKLEKKENELKTNANDKKETYQELNQLVKRSEPTEPEFNTSLMQYTSIIAGIIVVILLVLHGVIWVLKLIFDISWDTWGWTKTAFWWGLGITIVVSVLSVGWYYWRKSEYEKDLEAFHDYQNTKHRLDKKLDDLTKVGKRLIVEAESIESDYSASLAKDFREVLGIPIGNHSIAFDEREEAEQAMLQHYNLCKQANESTDPETMRKHKEEELNDKLRLFYQWSIRGEAAYTYPVFQSQLKAAQRSVNWGLLRTNNNDEVADMHFSKLPKYTALLKDNTMKPILDNLNELKSFDTKGLFGMQDVDALATKTEMLQDLFRVAHNEYQELSRINNNIGYLLEYVRVCAYRNIYLGVELLNYIRNNAGGKSLTTEKDMVSVNVELENINVSIDSLKLDVIGNLTNTVNNYIEIGTRLLNNDEAIDFLSKKPKAALGIAAAAIAFDAISNVIDERNEKIKQNNKVQQQAIKNIQLMVDNYNKGQGELLRAIEIIKAIAKANDGFMHIYEPLRDRVFSKNEQNSVTKMDIVELASAINEYNKISKAKI